MQVQGELDDHEKLVSALGQVEVVISALAVPQHLEQLKIIAAIKQARNIKVIYVYIYTLVIKQTSSTIYIYIYPNLASRGSKKKNLASQLIPASNLDLNGACRNGCFKI